MLVAWMPEHSSKPWQDASILLPLSVHNDNACLGKPKKAARKVRTVDKAHWLGKEVSCLDSAHQHWKDHGSGCRHRIQPVIDPYYYHDALRDGIVDEVLFPRMIKTWFRNRERDMFWRGPGRQAYHRGKPVRQLAYGNCYNCLRAGGLTQICGFCGGEDRFHAMVLFDTIDIPNTVVDARFLHGLVGYPDL